MQGQTEHGYLSKPYPAHDARHFILGEDILQLINIYEARISPIVAYIDFNLHIPTTSRGHERRLVRRVRNSRMHRCSGHMFQRAA
jgi:hypothetical protein